jgi:hypothetical protein
LIFGGPFERLSHRRLGADDNPANNELAVRALEKFGLDIEQAIRGKLDR